MATTNERQREQLETRNEAIHGEIMAAASDRDAAEDRIDKLSSERLANAQRINELLREEIAARATSKPQSS